MSNKCFFGVFAVALFAMLITVVIISYTEDPGGVFRNGYEQDIIDILISGKNAANVENYDERILQKYLINQYPRVVDAAVIGSSRIMQIRDSFIEKNENLLNNGVSGASIEDEIAIIWMYYYKGNLPNYLIIGVDPWIFNTNNDQTRWYSIYDEYNHGMELLKLDSGNYNYSLPLDIQHEIKKTMSLISRDILFASLNKIVEGKSIDMYPTDEINADVGIRLTDGSISYPKKYRDRNYSEVNQLAQDYISGPIYSLNSFVDINIDNKNKFIKLIDFLQNNDVRITFLLPPYHPIVYNEIIRNPQYSNVLAVENMVKDIGKKKNITTIGSYDPSKQNFTSHDFSDGMHLNMQGVNKLRNDLFPTTSL